MGSHLQRFALACVVLALATWSRNQVHAQVNYLEPIGGSEVELFIYLDAEPGSATLQRDGQQFKLNSQGLNATYTVSRGKVTNVTYRQTLGGTTSAEKAYTQIRKFMEDKGMRIQDIRDTVTHRVLSGEGSGMNGTLMMVPIVGGGYHVNAEISAMR